MKSNHVLKSVTIFGMCLSLVGCSSSSASENIEETAEATVEATMESEEVSETSSEAGAQTIEILDADGNNTELSAGSTNVTIGNKEVTLTGVYVIDGIDATIVGGTYESTGTDENVFLVINGGSLTLRNAEIIKNGDASTSDSTRTSDVSDDYNFYGINSVILVVGEDSSATITDCKITSDASGANAIFATDGATISVENVEISTTGNSSRGVYATYEGTIDANYLTITTTGSHCAPIATDRGGGYVTVKNSVVSSSGDGSPNIYSTGQIIVENVIGTSTGAQAAVIEGKNSITMTDCVFTVTGSGNNGVMLYQSMSGDAADSDATHTVSTLTMTNTTITLEIEDAPMFYITNTDSEIYLNGGNALTTSSGVFVSAATGRWGSDGNNGGDVSVYVDGETITDALHADDISSITVTLTNGSMFTGTTSGNVTVE